MDLICGWYVANSIIGESFKDKIFITPLKLNILIYLLYSNYLFKTGNKLFNELFIKTKNVPILPSVEFKFGCYKNKIITDFAKDSLGKIYMVNSFYFNECLSYIWDNYKYMDNYELLLLISKMDVISQIKENGILSDADILDNEIEVNSVILKRAKQNRKRFIGC